MNDHEYAYTLEIIENVFVEWIKEVEANRKRIMNITTSDSEQLGKACM